MTTEADTCRKYVTPKLYAAGWSDGQINEQRTFTDGRIMVAGTKVYRRPQKRADYLLKALPIALPTLAEQQRIVAELDALQSEVDTLKRLQTETATELAALMPSILDLAFKGEL